MLFIIKSLVSISWKHDDVAAAVMSEASYIVRFVLLLLTMHVSVNIKLRSNKALLTTWIASNTSNGNSTSKPIKIQALQTFNFWSVIESSQPLMNAFDDGERFISRTPTAQKQKLWWKNTNYSQTSKRLLRLIQDKRFWLQKYASTSP